MNRTEHLADGVTLHLGDCRAILPTLPRADAVVTDPPYDVDFKYESHNDTASGYLDWCRAWFSELRAMTDGPIAISCGIANITDWPKPNWVLCWHKPASMGRCAVGFNNWEPVLVYGKTRGGQVVDVFCAPIIPSEDVKGHPCPKPVAWAAGIIERVSASGDLVLDPFMGSGTTGIAAVKLGRRYIGIEIEPSYFDLSRRRISDALARPDLFIKTPAHTRPAELDLTTR